MSRVLVQALVAVVLVAASSSVSLAADAFPKTCTPPYNGKWKKQNIDKKCPPEDKVSWKQSADMIASHEAQSRLRSGIRPQGSPKQVTLATLGELQQALQGEVIDFRSSSRLPDRPLQASFRTGAGTLKEVDVVVLEGYLQHAKDGAFEPHKPRTRRTGVPHEAT